MKSCCLFGGCVNLVNKPVVEGKVPYSLNTKEICSIIMILGSLLACTSHAGICISIIASSQCSFYLGIGGILIGSGIVLVGIVYIERIDDRAKKVEPNPEAKQPC